MRACGREPEATARAGAPQRDVDGGGSGRIDEPRLRLDWSPGQEDPPIASAPGRLSSTFIAGLPSSGAPSCASLLPSRGDGVVAPHARRGYTVRGGETIRSDSPATQWTLHGVLKTTNGGFTWDRTIGGFGLPVTALAVDPARPATIYAGVAQREYRVARSTDGGLTWVPVG